MGSKTVRFSDKWTHRFLGLASYYATWSKDPSTKVGAVIVDRRQVPIALGFNGFPRGVEDNPEQYANREEKYPRTCHAEANAIAHASVPLHFADAIMFCTHAPCNECAKMIIQNGLLAVHTYRPDEGMKQRWGKSFDIAMDMFQQAGVYIEFHDHPTQSAFVQLSLKRPPEGEHPSWEYYAAHYLIGSGLIDGDLDGNIRSLASQLQKANERDKLPFDRRV